MKIPISIVVVFVGAGLALQGWTLVTVLELKIQVAAIEQRLTDHERTTASLLRQRAIDIEPKESNTP
jgi:hypothetical protein